MIDNQLKLLNVISDRSSLMDRVKLSYEHLVAIAAETRAQKGGERVLVKLV